MSRPNWFIGLPVPGHPWFEGLTPVPRGARALHPDDLHLTVAFLGAVGEQRARAAWAVAEAATGAGSLTFVPGAILPFGNPRRPSAFSVVPRDGGAPICELIGRIRDPILTAAQARLDPRPPRPHATVARPGRKAGSEMRRALASWAAAQQLPDGPVLLEQIALFTWSEDRRTRLFRVVASRPL